MHCLFVTKFSNIFGRGFPRLPPPMPRPQPSAAARARAYRNELRAVTCTGRLYNYIAMASVGLQKSKKYKWKESNLALFGSDLEKKVR